jgi:hypothetical protein
MHLGLILLAFILLAQEVTALHAGRIRSKVACLVTYSIFSLGSPIGANAAAASKSEFLQAVDMGVGINNREALETIRKSQKARAPAPSLSSDRKSQGRGGEGLASYGAYGSGSEIKGSLKDQLKGYGGPGEVKRADNSLKNQLNELMLQK